MENNALHPMHNPMKMEVIKTMSVYEDPTAAKAFCSQCPSDDECIGNIVSLLEQVS